MLGKLVQRTAKLDKRLARDLKSMAEPSQLFDTVTGKTMCTYDFYEGKNFSLSTGIFFSKASTGTRVFYLGVVKNYLATHF